MTKDDTVTMTLRLPRKLHKAVTDLARREMSSVNREAILALSAHVESKKGRAA